MTGPVTPPTEAEWLTVFVYGQMGVPVSALPIGSIASDWAYGAAVEIVNQQLQAVSPLIYKLAVYNLAASNLINFAADVPQTPPLPAGQLGYFAQLRQMLGINSLTVGVPTSGSDDGTSVSILVPDFFKSLSLADLAYLKDPYGRIYFSFAQRYTTVWGIS